MISYLDEALIGIRVVKAFNAVKFVTGRFQKENKQLSSLTRAIVLKDEDLDIQLALVNRD